MDRRLQAHRGSNRILDFLCLNITATTSTALARLIRLLEIAAAKHGCRDGRSVEARSRRAAGGPIRSTGNGMLPPLV